MSMGLEFADAAPLQRNIAKSHQVTGALSGV